jgi:Fatty acid hydroxylase
MTGELLAGNVELARRVKRRNALAALGFGALLVAGAAWASPPGIWRALVGFVLGLLYANLFEYSLHRFALHATKGFLPEKHGLHHSTWGSDDEPLYVNFARSPWVVVGLVAANALPVAALEWLWRPGLAAGALAAFAIYFVIFEELHWRIHMGGLPRWLEFSRRHHLAHHAGAPGRFDVWLPLGDWVLR